MKKGLVVFSFTEVAVLRLIIASISLLPFLYFAFKKVKKHHFFPLIITGFLGSAFPAFLFTKAQTVLDSSTVGMLNSLTPFFTLLVIVFLGKYRLSKLNLFGIFLGLVGTFFLVFEEFSILGFNNYNVFYVIIATFFYAISINIIKYCLYDLESIFICAFSFLFCAIPFIPFLIKSDIMSKVGTDLGFQALIYVTLLAVVGTSFAVALFNYLIKRSSPIFASSVTYLIPIVAIIWGFLDGEEILFHHVFGILIILTGVYLVNKKHTNYL